MRGSREGVAEGPDSLPGKSETLGLFSNTDPDPLENQKLPKSVSELSWTSSDKISGSAHY